MGTRYDIGDKVKVESNPDATFMVEDIYDPTSDSPTYKLEIVEGEPKETDLGGVVVGGEYKASDMKLADPVDIDADVRASDSDSVEQATNELRRNFENFENNNEQFHYNKTVVDQDGYKVAILVDFGIEDYETGGYYMGNVMATREDQPSQDAEDIAMSNAFYTAQQIVEDAAATGLTDMSRRDARWDNHEDGEHVDASLAIIFNESNL